MYRRLSSLRAKWLVTEFGDAADWTVYGTFADLTCLHGIERREIPVRSLRPGARRTTTRMARNNLSNVDSPSRRMVARSCFAVLVVCIFVGGVYFARQSGTNAEVYSNDFNVYYHAAKEVLAGRDPYQNSLGAWTPYLYPPLLAELLIPLSMLSLPIAAYLWFLISAASMFSAARMSASMSAWMSGETLRWTSLKRESEDGDVIESREPQLARHRALQAAIAAGAIVVLIRFVLDTFNLGQVNTVVAGLAVAHIYFYARDKKALSAIALVLAVSIKLTPAVFLVYHVAKMRLRFAAACIAGLAGVTVLSFLPFEGDSLDTVRIFANRTLRNEQGYNLADSGNQSLRGAIARLVARAGTAGSGGPESRNPTEPLTLMVAMLLLAFAVLAARRAQNELAGAAPFFCCVVLLSPLSWKAHFVILALPVAYLLSVLFQPGTPAGSRRLVLGTIATSFVLFNLTSPVVIGLAAAEWADAHSLVTLGALLIFFISVALNLGKFGKQERVC
jgi:alpha-1,2-mannosyltransferase